MPEPAPRPHDAATEPGATLPPSLRLAHLIPPATFILIATLSMVGFFVLGETFRTLADSLTANPALRITDLTAPTEAAALTTAAWIWAGTAFAAAVTTIATLAVAGAVIADTTPPADPFRRAALAFLAAFFIIALLVDLLINGSNPYHDILPGPAPGPDHTLARAIYITTSTLNALTMTVIAALLAASTAIIRAAQRLDAIPEPERPARLTRLQHRLTLLLGAGAVATVVGVIEIAALNNLPPAALATATTPSTADLPAVTDALHDVANALASYWGIVFTLGLALLYLPPAWVIRSRAASLPAPDPATTPPSSRAADILRPLAKVLTALAPLLAGALSQILSSATGLF